MNDLVGTIIFVLVMLALAYIAFTAMQFGVLGPPSLY